ncbi:MAG: hypothetical protein ABW189_01040 [Rickettsiales bacterium]
MAENFNLTILSHADNALSRTADFLRRRRFHVFVVNVEDKRMMQRIYESAPDVLLCLPDFRRPDPMKLFAEFTAYPVPEDARPIYRTPIAFYLPDARNVDVTEWGEYPVTVLRESPDTEEGVKKLTALCVERHRNADNELILHAVQMMRMQMVSHLSYVRTIAERIREESAFHNEIFADAAEICERLDDIAFLADTIGSHYVDQVRESLNMAAFFPAEPVVEGPSLADIVNDAAARAKDDQRRLTPFDQESLSRAIVTNNEKTVRRLIDILLYSFAYRFNTPVAVEIHSSPSAATIIFVPRAALGEDYVSWILNDDRVMDCCALLGVEAKAWTRAKAVYATVTVPVDNANITFCSPSSARQKQSA